MSEKKYASEEWLRERYFEDEMSVPQIAEQEGVVAQTIYDWMDRHGIGRDATRYGYKSRVPYATYYTDDQGYPRWQAKGRENGERTTYNFHVHRLVAIAEFGVEAVVGKHVHHKNEVRFDNRPENLELLTPGEHRTRHMTPETVDMMVRSRGQEPPARTGGGFALQQVALDGDDPAGQVTLDGDIVREEVGSDV